MKSWVNDFEKQDKKKIEVSDMYIKAFNGEYPEQFVTGKKWYEDVDTLFLCHHVNGDLGLLYALIYGSRQSMYMIVFRVW